MAQVNSRANPHSDGRLAAVSRWVPGYFDRGYFGMKPSNLTEEKAEKGKSGYIKGYEVYDNRGFWQDTLNAIRDNLPNAATAKFLEVGSAVGYLLKYLQEDFPEAQIFGADISRFGLQKSRENAPRAPLTQINLDTIVKHDTGQPQSYDSNVPNADESFGCTICLDVLEHTHNLPASIREAARVTKKDGLVIIGIPVRFPGIGQLWWDIIDQDLSHRPESIITKKQLQSLLETNGLKLIKENSGYYFPLPNKKVYHILPTNYMAVCRKT
jgi:SAM-dependent methyltransferase